MQKRTAAPRHSATAPGDRSLAGGPPAYDRRHGQEAVAGKTENDLPAASSACVTAMASMTRLKTTKFMRQEPADSSPADQVMWQTAQTMKSARYRVPRNQLPLVWQVPQ